MVYQSILEIATAGRGTVEVSAQVASCLRSSGIATGLAQVFIHHTSASLLITENADPAVRRDLERILSRLALGTWQGIYVWEHRHAPHRRRLTVTVIGD